MFSSDLVFDGASRSPYRESDHAMPLSVFGRCKRRAEKRVLAQHRQTLVIRSGTTFGPWDTSNFLTDTRRTLQRQGRFTAPDDLCFSPTYLPDMVHASLDLLIDGEHGIWHLANTGVVTWVELAREAARRGGFQESAVQAQPAHLFGWAAPRPVYSVLGSERGMMLPQLPDALERYFAEAVVD